MKFWKVCIFGVWGLIVGAGPIAAHEDHFLLSPETDLRPFNAFRLFQFTPSFKSTDCQIAGEFEFDLAKFRRTDMDWHGLHNREPVRWITSELGKLKYERPDFFPEFLFRFYGAEDERDTVLIQFRHDCDRREELARFLDEYLSDLFAGTTVNFSVPTEPLDRLVINGSEIWTDDAAYYPPLWQAKKKAIESCAPDDWLAIGDIEMPKRQYFNGGFLEMGDYPVRLQQYNQYFYGHMALSLMSEGPEKKALRKQLGDIEHKVPFEYTFVRAVKSGPGEFGQWLEEIAFYWLENFSGCDLPR